MYPNVCWEIGQFRVPNDHKILEIDCDEDDDITDFVSIFVIIVLVLVLLLIILRLLVFDFILIFVLIAIKILVILMIAIDTWNDDRALVLLSLLEICDNTLNDNDNNSSLFCSFIDFKYFYIIIIDIIIYQN